MPTLITVARADTGGVAHFPDIVRLAGERLLATYRVGAGHLSPEGRIAVVDSADGGRTWGRPRIAVDGAFDDRDPELARLAGGTVLLSYFVIDWSSSPRHTTHGTYVCRSTDGGRSWGDAAPVGSRSSGRRWAGSSGGPGRLPGLVSAATGRRPGR